MSVAVNDRARFDYGLLESINVGIVLSGHEAKSIKMGHVTLRGARVIVRDGELYIVGLDVPSFQPSNVPSPYEPTKTRKLLAKKEEIAHLAGKLQSGLTIIPVKVYTHRGFVKLEIALARHRKNVDKRALIKKRESLREIKRGDAGL